MKSDNNKIWDIANDDLVLISAFFGKIKATAVSAYSYLDSSIIEPGEPNERINNVLYMLDVIEDLSKTADNDLSEIINKLSTLSHDTEEKVKQEVQTNV